MFKFLKAKLTVILFIGMCLNGLKAQGVIPATGANAVGNGGSVTYSIGQIFYSTSIGANGSVAEGVQQPFDISVVLGVDETIILSTPCQVYPNPTSDFLILKIEDSNSKNLFYQLYDVYGKFYDGKKIERNETIIKMSNLIPATYFLRIIQNNKELKSFKIIKY